MHSESIVKLFVFVHDVMVHFQLKRVIPYLRKVEQSLTFGHFCLLENELGVL